MQDNALKNDSIKTGVIIDLLSDLICQGVDREYFLSLHVWFEDIT